MSNKNNLNVTVTIGKDRYRSNVFSYETSDVIVAGASKTGKSQLIDDIVFQLFLKYDKAQFVKCFFHKKDIPTDFFQRKKIYSSLITKEEDFTRYLEKYVLGEEFVRRYDLLQKNKCSNIEEFNNSLTDDQEKMQYVFIVIDALGGLKSQKANHLLLSALQKTRAIGFHFIVSTTHISSRALPKALLVNFQLRILLGGNFVQTKKLMESQARFLGDDFVYDAFPKGTAIVSCFSSNKSVRLEQIRIFYDGESRPLLANISSIENYPDYIAYSEYFCLECGFEPIYFSQTKCPIGYLFNEHDSYVSILVGSLILGTINFFSEIIERYGENSLSKFNDVNFVKRLFIGTKKSERITCVFSEKKYRVL